MPCQSKGSLGFLSFASCVLKLCLGAGICAEFCSTQLQSAAQAPVHHSVECSDENGELPNKIVLFSFWFSRKKLW